MILRTCTRALSLKGTTSLPHRAPIRAFRACRRYSTSHAASNGAPASQSQAAMLGTITADMDRISPRFEIQPSQILIIQTPSEFYETLKAKILSANDRVYLSTLYVGKTEHDLIDTLRTALSRNPDLKVSILTDCLRGTRETPSASSASLLAPLVSEFGTSRVEIRMFHTPNLTGVRKAVIPRRINEGWGLQHMKLYGADDEIILSGANLSSDYFTNRQDRYHVFKSKDLTDYFWRVQESVQKLSFEILPSDEPAGYTMTWPASNPGPSPLEDVKGFKKAATKLLAPLLGPDISPVPSKAPSSSPSSVPQTTASTTNVYPILSLVPLLQPNTSTELPTLKTLLTHLSSPPFHPSTWTFTAGYFNMTPVFRRLLLSTNPAHGTILTAHPHANGFYGSKGVSGMLPDAYTHLARGFLRRVRVKGLDGKIEMREWKKGKVGEEDGWTYHAKGLWVGFPETASPTTSSVDPKAAHAPRDPDPSVTVIGSSNFTARAYSLDLEAGVLVATNDPDLRRRLGDEVQWLSTHAQRVDETEFQKPERKVSLSVKFSMWLVKVLGGAL